MRLTLRVLKSAMVATDYGLDEIAGKLRGTQYAEAIAEVRKLHKATLRRVGELLDIMIDQNYGD